MILIPVSIFGQSSTSSYPDVGSINSSLRVEKRIDSLLGLMTIQEKIGQLVLYNGSWDVTGPPSDAGGKEKYEKLKKGEVGAMLNVVSVAGTKELQNTVMKNARLKILGCYQKIVLYSCKRSYGIWNKLGIWPHG